MSLGHLQVLRSPACSASCGLDLFERPGSFPLPSLQAHASAAVLNFTENCAPEILEPYLDGLINKLLVLLQVRPTLANFGLRTVLLSFAALFPPVVWVPGESVKSGRLERRW
jgi:hypothetical protein